MDDEIAAALVLKLRETEKALARADARMLSHELIICALVMLLREEHPKVRVLPEVLRGQAGNVRQKDKAALADQLEQFAKQLDQAVSAN